jgi:hypothetical protein
MFDVVNKDVDHVSVLAAIPPEVVARKQRKIREIAPRLQYSMVPQRLLSGEGQGGEGIMRSVLSNGADASAATWSPPFRDAADVIVDKITDPATTLPRQPGQMDPAAQRAVLDEMVRSGATPDHSLLTRPECVTVDVFNNYMRSFHPHWNGGSTTSTGEVRRWRNETASPEERERAVIACNIDRDCDIMVGGADGAPQPQRDQFSRRMFLNITHMLHSKYKLDLFNLTLFDKLRHNPNIPYIRELYDNYVV